MKNQVPIKLLVTIVDRGKGPKAARIYGEGALHFGYLLMGNGTATSQTLDLFGLEETEKDIVLSLVPSGDVPKVMVDAAKALSLERPGNGIMFTVPLSGACKYIPSTMDLEKTKETEEKDMDEKEIEEENEHDMILVMVNQGYTDTVMDAARDWGARGGTVIRARSLATEAEQKAAGLSYQPEREIVAILAARDGRHDLMKAVSQAAGPSTEAAGILFSLPVDDMMGLSGAGMEDFT